MSGVAQLERLTGQLAATWKWNGVIDFVLPDKHMGLVICNKGKGPRVPLQLDLFASIDFSNCSSYPATLPYSIGGFDTVQWKTSVHLTLGENGLLGRGY